MPEKKFISLDDIKEAVAIYCDYYECEPENILIDYQYEGKDVVGFRLSLDKDGRSKGCDEQYGSWGE